ncbi:MAG: transposase [Chitinophagaceae bacterium]
MSKKTRRNFSASFKAKVAIEALKEQSTLAQLAVKYELDPNQITDWKKQLLTGSEGVFEGGRKRESPPGEDLEKEELYKAVGQLKIENDWLKKKSEQIFGKTWKNGFGK